MFDSIVQYIGDFFLELPWFFLEMAGKAILAFIKFFLSGLIDQSEGYLESVETYLKLFYGKYDTCWRTLLDTFFHYKLVAGAFGWYIVIVIQCVIIRVILFVYHQFWGAN